MAGERVARTNRQIMLVVTTLAPLTAGEGRKDEQTKNARGHNSSPSYSRRNGQKDK